MTFVYFTFYAIIQVPNDLKGDPTNPLPHTCSPDVIRLIQSDTIKILKLSGMFEPGDVILLLTAPLRLVWRRDFPFGHSKFGFQPLSNDRLSTLRSKLSKLMLFIMMKLVWLVQILCLKSTSVYNRSKVECLMLHLEI